MTDYIKREDAINAIRSAFTGITADTMELRVNSIPSADVAPVRHGRWIEYGENKDGTYNIRCSKCGAGLKSKGRANSYYTKHKYRYCQNCGAKMDLED